MLQRLSAEAGRSYLEYMVARLNFPSACLAALISLACGSTSETQSMGDLIRDGSAGASGSTSVPQWVDNVINGSSVTQVGP